VTRNLSSKLTLDLRYIGTLSRKLPSNLDLNSANFLYNGLKDAFDAARRGGESPLLDQMFKGLNIAGTGFGPVGGPDVNGVAQTGALHLRSFLNTRTNLANGNYVALANTLNTLTNSVSGSLNGSVLRYNGFPENFIKTNPQFSTAVLETNLGHANYHSLQTQINLRPTAGVSSQMTYTWSRNLGQVPGEGANGTGAGFTDPTNRAGDYSLLSTHREHVLVDYGTFALPIGPQKRLFGKSTGLPARLMENWEASWVVNLSSGAPLGVGAQSMLYGLGVPDIVGSFDTKDMFQWQNGAPTGNLFADSSGKPLYSKVRDPQCLNSSLVAPSLQTSCTLNALQNSSGQVVLQTPLPGTRETFGQNRIVGLNTWSADMAMQKRIRVAETKTFTIRVDARNVFNHPTPALPGLFSTTGGTADLNTTSLTNPFGAMTTKTGNRSFQLKARMDFSVFSYLRVFPSLPMNKSGSV